MTYNRKVLTPEEMYQARVRESHRPKSYEEMKRGILAGTASDQESYKLDNKSSLSTGQPRPDFNAMLIKGHTENLAKLAKPMLDQRQPQR